MEKHKNMRGASTDFRKLIYAGLTKKRSRSGREGEKIFPLEWIELKTKPISERSTIIVELNEEGIVADLWKAP
jgi:hypothetical protein